jgi:hypothetical protein
MISFVRKTAEKLAIPNISEIFDDEVTQTDLFAVQRKLGNF